MFTTRRDWIQNESGRIALLIADCVEQKPTPGPRACPLVRQWCATVSAEHSDWQRSWARETGKTYKPAPVHLDPLALLPI